MQRILFLIPILLCFACGPEDIHRPEFEEYAVHAEFYLPGSDKDWLEDKIALPIEKEFHLINGITKVESYIRNGAVSIACGFNVAMDQNEAHMKVVDAVNSTRDQPGFPYLDYDPKIFVVDENYWPVLRLHFDSDTHSRDHLEEIALDYQDAINRLPSVSDAALEHELERYVLVELDPYKMEALQITRMDVRNAFDIGTTGINFSRWPITDLHHAGNRVRLDVLNFEEAEGIEDVWVEKRSYGNKPTHKPEESFALLSSFSEIHYVTNGEENPVSLLISKRSGTVEELKQLVNEITSTMSMKRFGDGFSIELEILPIPSGATVFHPEFYSESPLEQELIIDRNTMRMAGVNTGQVSNELRTLMMLYPDAQVEELLEFSIVTVSKDGQVIALPLKSLVKVKD